MPWLAFLYVTACAQTRPCGARCRFLRVASDAPSPWKLKKPGAREDRATVCRELHFFSLQGHSGGENALQQTASMQGRSPESRLLRAMSGESHPDAEDLAAALHMLNIHCMLTSRGGKMCRSICVTARVKKTRLFSNAEFRKSSLAFSEVVSDRDVPWLSFEAARLTSFASQRS